MKTDLALAKKYSGDYLVIGRKLVSKVGALAIKGQTDLDVARLLLKECQATEQSLEAKRNEITKPLNDFIKEANSMFKETALPILEAKATIKSKMVDYEEKIRKIEEARLAKIEEARLAREAAERKRQKEEDDRLRAKQAELDAKEAKIEREKLEVLRAQRLIAENAKRQKEEAEAERLAKTKVKGVTKTWTWDIENEQSIPRQFCSPDSKKINEAIKSGVRDIAGLKIYEQTSVK